MPPHLADTRRRSDQERQRHKPRPQPHARRTPIHCRSGAHPQTDERHSRLLHSRRSPHSLQRLQSQLHETASKHPRQPSRSSCPNRLSNGKAQALPPTHRLHTHHALPSPQNRTNVPTTDRLALVFAKNQLSYDFSTNPCIYQKKSVALQPKVAKVKNNNTNNYD